MWISSREEDRREPCAYEEPGHRAGAPDRTLLSRGHQKSERGNRWATEEQSTTRRGRMHKRLERSGLIVCVGREQRTLAGVVSLQGA